MAIVRRKANIWKGIFSSMRINVHHLFSPPNRCHYFFFVDVVVKFQQLVCTTSKRARENFIRRKTRDTVSKLRD